jgi:hypothetical protein
MHATKLPLPRRPPHSVSRSPSTVSSVHSGACDATHAAIVKPGTPDRSRRRARRAICGTPGAPYHGTARLLLAVTGQQRFEGALIGAAREELLTIDLGCCPRRAFAAGRPAAKVATFQWPCGAANSRSRLARPAARIFCTRRDQGLLYKRTPSENPIRAKRVLWWGIQINSERYMQKIEIIGVRKTCNIFMLSQNSW